jgi:hypothetical protein
MLHFLKFGEGLVAVSSNIAIMWVALQLLILGVTSSNLDLETRYPDKSMSWVSPIPAGTFQDNVSH